MLIFSRNAGEDFYIGENVRVVILACDRRGRVRLGVEGPRDIAIVRGELVRGAHRSCDATASTDENKQSA
jgi:carbon storage regulator CsrA